MTKRRNSADKAAHLEGGCGGHNAHATACLARLRAVRRTFLLLLLAFLPLQFSWAAVAAYCHHEVRSEVEPRGYHEHQHQHQHAHEAESRVASDAPAEPGRVAALASDQDAGAMDLDCGHCHGHCHCIALPAFAGLALGSLTAALPQASADTAQGARAAPRPERPQWARLA